MTPPQFRLHWRNQRTGETGVGSLRYPQSTAENLAARLNYAPKMLEECIFFWAEPVGEPVARPSYKRHVEGKE